MPAGSFQHFLICALNAARSLVGQVRRGRGLGVEALVRRVRQVEQRRNVGRIENRGLRLRLRRHGGRRICGPSAVCWIGGRRLALCMQVRPRPEACFSRAADSSPAVSRLWVFLSAFPAAFRSRPGAPDRPRSQAIDAASNSFGVPNSVKATRMAWLAADMKTPERMGSDFRARDASTQARVSCPQIAELSPPGEKFAERIERRAHRMTLALRHALRGGTLRADRLFGHRAIGCRVCGTRAYRQRRRDCRSGLRIAGGDADRLHGRERHGRCLAHGSGSQHDGDWRFDWRRCRNDLQNRHWSRRCGRRQRARRGRWGFGLDRPAAAQRAPRPAQLSFRWEPPRAAAPSARARSARSSSAGSALAPATTTVATMIAPLQNRLSTIWPVLTPPARLRRRAANRPDASASRAAQRHHGRAASLRRGCARVAAFARPRRGLRASRAPRHP